jgi:hypothetical protein
MKRSLARERETLRGSTTSSRLLNDLLKYQDVTLEGVDVTLRVSFVYFLKLKSNYFVKGQNKGGWPPYFVVYPNFLCTNYF